MVPLKLQQTPPTLGSPVALPELTKKPCASLWRFLWYYMSGCSRPHGSYSATLNRAFVTGHRVTLLGWPSLVSFEIVAGEAKRLPAKVQGIRWVADVPKLNGSLFEGSAREVLFYDGASVTPLLNDFLDRSTSNISVTWIVKILASGRAFLMVSDRLGGQPVLMELKAGPTLIPIFLPDEFKKGWLSLFVFPGDPRLWGISLNRIMVQTDDRLQTVATVPASSLILGPAGLWQAPDGTIGFPVQAKDTGVPSDYFLVRALPDTPCDVPLNPARPIVFSDK